MRGILYRSAAEKTPKLVLVGAEIRLISTVEHERDQGQELDLLSETLLQDIVFVGFSEFLKMLQVTLHQLKQLLVDSLGIKVNEIFL